MTRKKAIEAAMKRLRAISEAATVRDDHGEVRYEGKPAPVDVEEEMQAIWEHARIAGLREAARMAVSIYVDYDFHGREKASVIEAAQDEVAAAIRDHARALANPKKPKKARGR